MTALRVFVGGLPSGTRKRDVFKFFHGYGRMREVIIKIGYAFVEFYDQCDADDAVYKLNGKKIFGERVTVELARGIPRAREQRRSRNTRGLGNYRGGNDRGENDRGPPTRTNYRVIVENLSSRVTWQDLKNFMWQAGEVTFAYVHNHRPNEGIVEFASLSDMKNAIKKLHDTELNGRRVRITEDKSGYKKRSSFDTRSRSRSYRSRSGSHSRSRSSARKAKPHSRSRASSKKRSKSRDPSSERSPDVSRGRSKSRELSKFAIS